jgi:hypothetical protein
MNNCLQCNTPVLNKYCSKSCQLKYQAFKKSGNIISFLVNCCKCKKSFEVKEHELKHPEKEKYHCSRSCANKKIHSEETKKKISNALEKPAIVIDKICKNCNNIFSVKTKRVNKIRSYCSDSCRVQSEITLLKSANHFSKMGKNSAASRVKRSKNEIHFYNLCCSYFDEVLHNECMFNGWDADIILPKQKIAIMWNGPWHYRKITKEHSLLQVQNRDDIKIKEIISLNYTPYIIRDNGSEDKQFVKDMFERFLKECAHLDSNQG